MGQGAARYCLRGEHRPALLEFAAAAAGRVSLLYLPPAGGAGTACNLDCVAGQHCIVTNLGPICILDPFGPPPGAVG